MHSNLIVYSILCFLITYVFTKVSYKLKLLDYPNARKVHSRATAFTGGLSISICLILSIFLFDINSKTLNQIFSISFIMSIVGLLDDKFTLNVGEKLSLQIIPVIYLISTENLMLTHLGDFVFFKLSLGSFSFLFTFACVLFLINSFNYFDGADGILGATSTSVLAILYYLVPDENFQLFIICLIIPITIFLFFNLAFFNLPKTFLGDSGSLLLGFVISFTLIYVAKLNLFHPIVLAWSISIFTYEFISIHLLRYLNNKDIFLGGHDHLHNKLLNQTRSNFFTNLIIILINSICFIIGYMGYLFVNSFFSLLLFFIFFIIYFFFRKIDYK